MASILQICNKALVAIGSSQIAALTDNSPSARLCNLFYEDSRDALLRMAPWRFATKRAQLVENLVRPPLHSRDRAFDVPDDYIGPMAPDPYFYPIHLDWRFEGAGSTLQILTNDSSPLDFIYTSQVKDPTRFDPLFHPALSALMAWEMAESLTQSNSKVRVKEMAFGNKFKQAAQSNSFEGAPSDEPMDDWVAVRFRGGRDNTRRFFR